MTDDEKHAAENDNVLDDSLSTIPPSSSGDGTDAVAQMFFTTKAVTPASETSEEDVPLRDPIFQRVLVVGPSTILCDCNGVARRPYKV